MMERRLIKIFLVLITITTLGACKTNVNQSSLQRTYHFYLMPQNSTIQFIFKPNQSYTSLTNLTLPSWQGCEGKFKIGAFTDCTKSELESYINNQFQIPSSALENVVEGKVKYKFVLDESGQIGSGQIMKNPGNGLGEEMERTLLSITQLEPANINTSEKVSSEITLEVFCDIVLR